MLRFPGRIVKLPRAETGQTVDRRPRDERRSATCGQRPAVFNLVTEGCNEWLRIEWESSGLGSWPE